MQHSPSDPRRRRLVILAAIAAVLVVFAALALWQQSEQLAPKYQPTTMFPDLPHQASSVAKIHIAAKKGSFDVVNKPNKGWVIASRNDFPASFEQVNRTVVGIAGLQLLEPRTARADWLHFLNLDAPPKGEGVLISLFDAKGQNLAAIIAGSSEDIGDRSGASGLFVRKPDSTQSWLAKGTLEPKAEVTDWYEKNLLSVERARIAQTDVTPSDGPAYSVKRDTAKDPSFKLVNLPAGRELAYPGAPDNVGAGIVGLTFDDVKPAKGMDFSKSGRIVTRTFDGLIVTLQVMEQGKDYWATVSAQAAPGKAAAAREAQAINGRASGWAYKLPPFRAQQLMAKQESLLKPLHSENTPAAAAPSEDKSEE
ncbi:MAG: DUF4340 domain-containing protein [Alphaproteobacteria bacterium]|nr:DUF4340 domain-containing protein [Alphaproteobacteria bacterium]